MEPGGSREFIDKDTGNPEGLPAITEVIGRGISVNVTLIFSVDRYVEVMDAYLSGLELAGTRGHDISRIESVASFFISRVDSRCRFASGSTGQ